MKNDINLNNCEQLEVELNFYTVRSKDGKFLRSKKHGFYGNFDTSGSWTENISEAKIYAKPGPARSQCTWWSKNYPSFGTPELVLITTGKCFIINEDEKIAEKKRKAAVQKAEKSLRNAIYYQEAHAAKVKLLRGDGKDPETLRLKKAVESLEKEVQQLRNSR
jgi:hypothetical protein